MISNQLNAQCLCFREGKFYFVCLFTHIYHNREDREDSIGRVLRADRRICKIQPPAPSGGDGSLGHTQLVYYMASCKAQLPHPKRDHTNKDSGGRGKRKQRHSGKILLIYICRFPKSLAQCFVRSVNQMSLCMFPPLWAPEPDFNTRAQNLNI